MTACTLRSAADSSAGQLGTMNAMLLNEFLKQHQTVRELKKQVAELTTDLQKVNAQVELSKSVSHIAENNP